MVGSANGMSMSTSRMRWPLNWSRTSTQAMRVPITTFTAVTMSAWRTVRRIAAAVCSLVIVFQNAVQPPSLAVTTTAVSGISTSRLNQIIATPEAEARRPCPGWSRESTGAEAPVDSRSTTAAVTRPCRTQR